MINQNNHDDPLLILLYELIESGVAEAHTFFDSRNAAPDPWLFPHIVRWSICRQLDSLADTNITYERVELPNSGIEVRADGQRLRIFKATPDGELPAPGRSIARQDFYTPNLFGTDADFFGTPSNLIVLWEADSAGHLIGIQLVCPMRDGAVSKPGQQMWAVTITHPAMLQMPNSDLQSGADLNISDTTSNEDLDIEEESGGNE